MTSVALFGVLLATILDASSGFHTVETVEDPVDDFAPVAQSAGKGQSIDWASLGGAPKKKASVAQQVIASEKESNPVPALARHGATPSAPASPKKESPPAIEHHHPLKGTVSGLLASSKIDYSKLPAYCNACVKGAKKQIKEVLKQAKAAQKGIDQMSRGKHCKHFGSKMIADSRSKLATYSAALRAANARLSRIKNMGVVVTVPFSQGEARNSKGKPTCGAFYNTASWRKAGRIVRRHTDTATDAKQALKDAQERLREEVATARKQRCDCKARVTKQIEQTLRRAQAMTPSRQRSIVRALTYICVIAGKATGHDTRPCRSKFMPRKYESQKVKLFRQIQLLQPKLAKMNFQCTSSERMNLYKQEQDLFEDIL